MKFQPPYTIEGYTITVDTVTYDTVLRVTVHRHKDNVRLGILQDLKIPSKQEAQIKYLTDLLLNEIKEKDNAEMLSKSFNI